MRNVSVEASSGVARIEQLCTSVGGFLDTIDWAAELRKIERQFDGLPPEPTPAESRARRQQQQQMQRTRETRVATTGVTFRVALVGALGIGLAFWPYGASCGSPLAAYLASVGTVVIGGFWTSMHTWQHRMPRMHVATIVLVLWGIVLAASQILPRLGYTPQAAVWSCR